jgi:hypothetical protein
MMRWVRWSAIALVAAAVLAFAGDCFVFTVRGGATEKVTVSHFLSAPLKNNKEELDYLGSEEVRCSVSLFPQGGHFPCWYLRSHKNQVTNI